MPANREDAWWVRDLAAEASDADPTLMGPHKKIWAVARSLYSQQYETRRGRAESALFLYYGSGRLSLGGRTSYFEVLAGDEPPHTNVIQSAVDAKTAQVYRNQVRPFFVTEKGSTELQEKVEGMQRAVEAGFRDIGIWDLSGFLCCQDGHLFEAGGLMIVPDFANSRPIASRVRSWECFVPERESRLGDPRQMHVRQLVDRGVLRALFADDERALSIIDESEAVSASWDDDSPTAEGDVSDLIEVWTSWHRPSGRVDLREKKVFGLKKADKGFEFDQKLDPEHDGRYCITVENGTLWDRPWPYDYFPIAWYKPSPNPVGYWSRSIPETLAGEQLELLKIGRRISGIMHLHSVPRLLVWRNARLNMSQLSNDYATILETSVPPGQAAMYLTPNAVPSELFQREGMIVANSEKKVGLNEMSIAGTKPPGVDHAPGMEHLADEQAVRHTPAFRAWERFHIQAAIILLDVYRQLAEYDQDFEVIWGEADDLKRIKWTEVDMERDKYHARVWPTNLFAQTPTMRIKQIVALVQNGVMPPQMAMRSLAGNPDVDALIGDVDSEKKNIENKLMARQRGDDGDRTIPHPYMNLALCKAIAKDRINKLEADGEKPEVIDRVIQFWELAHKLEMAEAQRQAAMQGPPAPGGPMPPPGMPPGPPGGAVPPANDNGAPPAAASGAN